MVESIKRQVSGSQHALAGLVVDINIAAIRIPDRLRALQDHKVTEFAESIAETGLINPITVRPKAKGAGYVLVAGRHRLEAVKQLKWEAVRCTVLSDSDADRAELVEIDENLIRAELSPAERALHLDKRKKFYEKLHPETQHGATGRGRQKSRQLGDSNDRFTKDTAKKTGHSERTIQRETKRGSIAALLDIIGTCLDQGAELDALAKLPEDQQRQLAKQAKAGANVSAKHIAKKLRRQKREKDLAAATKAASEAIGKKLYGVILADPPWQFQPYSRETGMDRAADNHYPTMSTAEIAAMPIPAGGDCILFLWATVPMLPDALKVMAGWGFVYKSCLFWKKDKAGTGYWTRNRVELLLIGTRGDIPAPAPGDQPPQLIEAPIGRHSEKPAIFAEYIEKFYPDVPKLEMFARTSRRGWDCWGNEAAPLTNENSRDDGRRGGNSDVPVGSSPPVIPDDLSIPDVLRRA
jgi:N6-adenosine-specific RNA methylase IME4